MPEPIPTHTANGFTTFPGYDSDYSDFTTEQMESICKTPSLTELVRKPRSKKNKDGTQKPIRRRPIPVAHFSTFATPCQEDIEQFIQSLRPEWSELRLVSIKADTTRSMFLFAISGHGQKFCLNQMCEHTSNRVFFFGNRLGIRQMCWSESEGQHGTTCNQFMSEVTPFPEMIQYQLYPDTITPQHAIAVLTSMDKEPLPTVRPKHAATMDKVFVKHKPSSLVSASSSLTTTTSPSSSQNSSPRHGTSQAAADMFRLVHKIGMMKRRLNIEEMVPSTASDIVLTSMHSSDSALTPTARKRLGPYGLSGIVKEAKTSHMASLQTLHKVVSSTGPSASHQIRQFKEVLLPHVISQLYGDVAEPAVSASSAISIMEQHFLKKVARPPKREADNAKDTEMHASKRMAMMATNDGTMGV